MVRVKPLLGIITCTHSGLFCDPTDKNNTIKGSYGPSKLNNRAETKSLKKLCMDDN